MYTQKGSESPVMNKAIKYRIYPTTEQKILFAKTFGCCRKVYNLMLSDKISSYQVSKSFGKQTPAMYKDEFPYLKEVDSLALTNVQIHLQTAMKNHFDKKRKKRTGFPKFKFAKRSRRSYTTNNQNGTVALVQNGLRLPKTGIVKEITTFQFFLSLRKRSFLSLSQTMRSDWTMLQTGYTKTTIVIPVRTISFSWKARRN